MKFASNNVDSSSDVSVVVRASSGGKVWKMPDTALNLLKMDKSFKKLASLDAFTDMYGSYLIIGFEYGGEVLFQSTKTARTLEDKMSIEAGLKCVDCVFCGMNHT